MKAGAAGVEGEVPTLGQVGIEEVQVVKEEGLGGDGAYLEMEDPGEGGEEADHL